MKKPVPKPAPLPLRYSQARLHEHMRAMKRYSLDQWDRNHHAQRKDKAEVPTLFSAKEAK